MKELSTPEKVLKAIDAHSPYIETDECDFGNHTLVMCCSEFKPTDRYDQMPEWRTHLGEMIIKELE